MTEQGAVSFKNLRILDVDQVDFNYALFFPCLRHVAFGNWCRYLETILLRSPQLESLLVRSTYYMGRYGMDPSLVPGLKLLGLPIYGGNTLPPVPNYPLRHLCLHMHFVPGLQPVDLVKQVSVHLPELCQITLDFTEASEPDRCYVESAFRGISSHLRSSGLVINQLFSRHIISNVL